MSSLRGVVASNFSNMYFGTYATRCGTQSNNIPDVSADLSAMARWDEDQLGIFVVWL